jgi:peptidoglycan hydrolase-like protein with peptidoglycan-binding domain
MTDHSQVSEVQQKLQQEGLYHGQVDGIIGPETKQALRQYQQQNGLQVTAELDQQTLDHLLGYPPGGQGSSSPNMAPHQPSGNNPNHPASGR